MYEKICDYKSIINLNTGIFMTSGGKKEKTKKEAHSFHETVYSCMIIDYCIIFHTNNCNPTFATASMPPNIGNI